MSGSKRVFHAGPEGTVVADEGAAAEGAEQAPKAPLEEMTFSTHVLSLHATGLMALGLLGEAEKDPETVRHIIETLAMLQAKTTGNLTREEDRLLTSVVHELRLKFVERP
ncbi:MAG: DUF1844 domain-containing protein [Myxococcales bacterium]|nr:DUF1844 domain-containing protein [Myxococcales bacterium]